MRASEIYECHTCTQPIVDYLSGLCGEKFCADCYYEYCRQETESDKADREEQGYEYSQDIDF